MRANLLSLLLLGPLVPASAGEHLPVLSGYPGCGYDPLGEVHATDGKLPDGSADDSVLRSAHYPHVFRRIAHAGEARGANAVVVRTHQAAFHVRNGRRSPRPVYVSITALAIRMHDPAACRTTPIDAATLQARALQGDAEDVKIEARPSLL